MIGEEEVAESFLSGVDYRRVQDLSTGLCEFTNQVEIILMPRAEMAGEVSARGAPTDDDFQRVDIVVRVVLGDVREE